MVIQLKMAMLTSNTIKHLTRKASTIVEKCVAHRPEGSSSTLGEALHTEVDAQIDLHNIKKRSQDAKIIREATALFKSLMILEEMLAVTDSAAASGLGTTVGTPTVPVPSDDVIDQLWETVAMVPVEKASPKSRKKKDALIDKREGARHLHFIAHAFTRVLGESFLANHTLWLCLRGLVWFIGRKLPRLAFNFAIAAILFSFMIIVTDTELLGHLIYKGIEYVPLLVYNWGREILDQVRSEFWGGKSRIPQCPCHLVPGHPSIISLVSHTTPAPNYGSEEVGSKEQPTPAFYPPSAPERHPDLLVNSLIGIVGVGIGRHVWGA